MTAQLDVRSRGYPDAADAALAPMVGEQLAKRWVNDSSGLASICHYALVPPGKLFRPILLLESALAVGGTASCVLPAAVGAESGHVASLVHDDIIDGDDLRRGRPSVQHRYGIGDAIVAGDALIFDMFASLAQCHRTGVPETRVVQALEAVSRAGLDLCRGQSLESELCRNQVFDLDAYLTMVGLKTASFFRGACESGALLGGGSTEEVAALSRYGDQLGIAFQIFDDLLAYTSDTSTTGKPGTSDVQNGRLTLPVLMAHRSGGLDERLQITRLLSPSHEDPQEALSALAEILQRTGALAAAAMMARQFAERAAASLESLAATPSRGRLRHYAELVISRNH